MRILQIIHCFPPESMTGSEIYAYNLSKELSRNHKVNVFYRINDPKKEEYGIIKENYEGLNVYKINNTLKGYSSIAGMYKNEEIEHRFIQVLDEVKPDIVHIHHLLFLSLGIIDEIKKRNIPIVFTLHDYWLVCPRGQLLKTNLRVCNRHIGTNCFYCLGSGLSLKGLLRRIAHVNKISISKKFTHSLKDINEKVDLFISPSRFLRNKFIEFGIPEKKIIYSDNGMNLDYFKDAEKIKSDKIRFGFIGTLISSKGAHVLIKAFNRIKSDKAILKIYGKSPVNNGIFNYRQRIKKAARYNRNIKFMGTFNNRDVAKIFKEIDILVFPSIWEENSPIVLHEATATRTPAIASNIGGVNELIKHGENGFLFKAGDFKELYVCMQNAMDSIEKIKNKIQNSDFSIKDIKDNCEEMEKLYAGKI